MVISNNADLKSNTNLLFNLGTRLYKLQQQEKKLTSQVITVSTFRSALPMRSTKIKEIQKGSVMLY